jgi:hypothetical protein
MDETKRLDEQLEQLHLHYIRSHYQEQANKAAEQQHPHVHYLAQLIEGEAAARENRAIQRRIDNRRRDDHTENSPQCHSRGLRNGFVFSLMSQSMSRGLAGTVGEPLKNKGIFWQPVHQQKIDLAGFGFLQVIDFKA